MYFYKYQKPENLEFNMLRHGEIYFAKIAELNDASECCPRFILNGTEKLWIRLAQFILSKVCFSSDYSDYYNRAKEDDIRQLLELSISVGKLLKKQVKNRDIGIENLGKLFTDSLKPLLELNFSTLQSKLILDLSHEFIDRKLPGIIDEPKYITSFYKSATNPTMWGHYAKAERGFVIVYSTEDGAINVRSPIDILFGSRPLESKFGTISEIGFYDDERLELQSVKYGKKPPKVNAFHRLITKFYYSEIESHYDGPALLEGDAKEKKEDQIGLVKYSDWRYEQEIRTFFPYLDEPYSPDMRVLQVSINNIKGLIFGPSMTDGDKKRAILCCYLLRKSLAHLCVGEDDTPPEFVFFQAIQVLDRFDFEIQPVGVLENHYSGQHPPIRLVQNLDGVTVERLRGIREEIK